ncbi:MAG: VIT1/CCC1 transporter family protein, partial [Polyangiaceae bacterium]
MSSHGNIATASRRSPAYHHDHVDAHAHASWFGQIILGGQDGLVNVLGLVLGVASATASQHVVIVAGLAAAFAESVSMAAVGYTTSVAEGDRYRAERAREY